MASVYKIEITQVEAEKKGDNAWRVRAYWKTDESANPYQSSYHMEITCDDGAVSYADTYEKSGEINVTGLCPQKDYMVKISVGEKSDEAPLLLHTYENAAGSYDGLMLRLMWDAPSFDIGGGRCFVTLKNGASFAYDIPPYVFGMEIPMKEELYGSDLVLSVSLQPYASPVSNGPSVTLPDLYHSRYKVEKSGDGDMRICYKDGSPDETRVSLELDGEIYAADGENGSKKPEAPVKAGPLELENAAPYHLNVRTDTLLERSDYDRFARSVCQLVTPGAMYEILEMITRCASYLEKDALYYHCGFRPAADGENENGRHVDARPGFFLRLEQAMYMPKEFAGGYAAAGFVGVHTAEYMVSLERGDAMQYLEFDSFVSAMDEDLYPPRGQEKIQPIAAGILDLCSARMRAPYWRIQYPDGIYSSDAPPDAYAENHTRLVAKAGWDDDLPSLSGGDGAPCLWFRGRSAMTLLISVVLNGTERKVPVGTTLKKLLSSAGIFGIKGKDVKWYRRNPFGKEAGICFEKGMLPDMALLNGDRIEA